jgi:hypothetical protein
MENVPESWNGVAIPYSEQMVAVKTMKLNEPRVALWVSQAQESDNQMPTTGPILIICILL